MTAQINDSFLFQDQKFSLDNIHHALNLHMDFTGGMLVASGFFHDLVFSQGTLLETKHVGRQWRSCVTG